MIRRYIKKYKGTYLLTYKRNHKEIVSRLATNDWNSVIETINRLDKVYESEE